MSIVEVTEPEHNQLGNLEDQVKCESKLNSARYKRKASMVVPTDDNNHAYLRFPMAMLLLAKEL